MPGHEKLFDLGKRFKSDERTETRLSVSEATTAIEKRKKPTGLVNLLILRIRPFDPRIWCGEPLNR
jgi:hypothetical protein